MTAALSHQITHHALCNHHLGGTNELSPEDNGCCLHTFAKTDAAEVEVALDDLVPRVHIYARHDDGMTASAARMLAASISAAADTLDALALPESEGQAVRVPLVAMLANVREFDVSNAISQGELEAFPAVDGSAALLMRWADAMAWALEQHDHDGQPDAL